VNSQQQVSKQIAQPAHLSGLGGMSAASVGSRTWRSSSEPGGAIRVGLSGWGYRGGAVRVGLDQIESVPRLARRSRVESADCDLVMKDYCMCCEFATRLWLYAPWLLWYTCLVGDSLFDAHAPPRKGLFQEGHAVNRHIEIRLYESLSEGCRVLSTPSHLLVSLQLDYPWSTVLGHIDLQASQTEKVRLRLLFETFIRERKFDFTGEYVAISEWPPHASTSAEAPPQSHLNP
jgi:hypothetical protein